MSAIEVTSQCSSSRLTWAAIVGSKMVTSIGTFSSTSRTISAVRNTTASWRETTTTRSIPPPSSACRTSRSSGVFMR